MGGGGREAQEGGDIYIYPKVIYILLYKVYTHTHIVITDVHCCMAETNMTL